MKFLIGILLGLLLQNITLDAQSTTLEARGAEIENLLKEADSIAKMKPDSAVLFLNHWIDNDKYARYEFEIVAKIGEIYKNKQDYTTSKKYFLKAYEIASKSQNSTFQSETLLELGRISRKLGNYDQALQYDLEALAIIEKEGKQKLYGLVCNYIGIDHYRYHNYEEAILYFNRSIKARKERGDSIGIADCYNNLGMVYDDQGELDKAFATYQKALSIYDNLNELDGIAASYNNMAGIYYQKNDFPKVIEYMSKVLDIRRKDGDKELLSFSLLNTASLYYAIKDIEKSIELNLEGLQLAKEVKAKSQKRRAYKGLSDAYLFMENYKKALEYRLLYEKVKDSIFEENKTKAIAEMHTKYETEKKEIENQLLKTENEKKTRYQIFLVSISAVLIALVLLLVYYLRLRSHSLKQQKELSQIKLTKKEQEIKHLQDMVVAEKQINQLQKENYEAALEHKNKQLMTSTACIVNKNEVLGKLKVEIKAMKSDFKEKSEVLRFINNNIDMDTDWNKFKMDFEAAHPGFFDRLNASFPGLSDTYQKIAAFLRIGLSSQEIADMLFVSIASVNKNRQRLRKKLGLEANADLTQFLENI